MSRSARGITTTSQISAPAQDAVNTMPPTTMNASGTSNPTVARTRPAGPNVVGVFRHMVARVGDAAGPAAATRAVPARAGVASAATAA